MPNPSRTGLWRTAERAVGGDLKTWIAEQMADGGNAPRVAERLQDLGVIVSRQTAYNWVEFCSEKAS